MFNRYFILFLIGTLFFLHDARAFTPNFEGTPVHEAFVAKFTDPIAPTVIARPPPAPRNDPIPPQPAPDTIWIPGYFAWVDVKGDFEWVCGVWRRPPPNQFWIAGFWVNHQGGWSWARGFWSNVPMEQLALINIPPPRAIDDRVPAAPGENYFWVPGYWEFTGTYSWLSGKWEQFNPNWVLAPASYVWRPNGYLFSPLHWDYNLDGRGNAYTCSSGFPVVLEPAIIIQNLFFCYPDYITFYWHWGFFHPNWWGDCWCLPPWWFWNDWWNFPWGDLWGLWWWWGHPGFFPPFWLGLELSSEIAPPPEELLEAIKKFPKPPFDFTPGDKPLLPKGPEGNTEPKRPHIPNDVTPKGTISLPNFPIIPPRTVTPPPPPSGQEYPRQPVQPNLPPQTQYPQYPRQPYPSDNVSPPVYYPPQYQPPSGRPRPPQYQPPSGRPRPPQETPPSGRYPPTRPPGKTFPVYPQNNGSTIKTFPSQRGSNYNTPNRNTYTPGKKTN